MDNEINNVSEINLKSLPPNKRLSTYHLLNYELHAFTFIICKEDSRHIFSYISDIRQPGAILKVLFFVGGNILSFILLLLVWTTSYQRGTVKSLLPKHFIISWSTHIAMT